MGKAKTTFSVTVSDGRGGQRVETRKSAHAYVACVIRTIGASYVRHCEEGRARDIEALTDARAAFTARSAALGNMTPETARATYEAANTAFWALSAAERDAAVVAAGGDQSKAAGLADDGPFGLSRAWEMIRCYEERLTRPLPVVGEMGAVSWHSSRALAVKALEALLSRDARHPSSAFKDDSYEVRDIGAPYYKSERGPAGVEACKAGTCMCDTRCPGSTMPPR